jgi:hypothetical protein
MRIQSIILLIISIMLVLVSSWNMSIFIRLDEASYQYQSDDEFDTACHISKKYVSTGKNVSTTMLVIFVILMLVSSVSIYRQSAC